MGYTFNDYSGPTTYNLVQALRLTPYGRVTRPNGELEKYPRELGGGLTNPLWLVNSGTVDDHDTYATTLIKGHVLVRCPWLEGLTYRVNAAIPGRMWNGIISNMRGILWQKELLKIGIHLGIIRFLK